MEEKLNADEVHTGSSVASLKQSFVDDLFYLQGRHPRLASCNDCYMAMSYAVRDRLLYRSLHTLDALLSKDNEAKLVCYFSAEYLIGPQLKKNLVNLEMLPAAEEAVESFHLKIKSLFEIEREPGLGNGGLGRLAACYIDSLASLEIPALGYGIRYEFGMFNQEIIDGWQVEKTDKWLSLGYPWEVLRSEISAVVKLGGNTEGYYDNTGQYHVKWNPARVVKGIAYDTQVVGYGGCTCNTLRLWKAEAIESFDFAAFNVGDYYRSVEQKMFSENITKVLYPNDEPLQGKQLRLEQQYFLVSCSLQDMIRICLLKGENLSEFHKLFAAQLNDTHPSLAIPELMRLFVDEYYMQWDEAWKITTQTFAYTNHTLLPEALEKWPLKLFQKVLPRHLEIILEINRRFLDEVRLHYPDDIVKLRRMSLIDEEGERYVRMANLACVGSHTVNGVAPLHTDLLKKEVMPDFVDLWPAKFINITNGVSHRRFLLTANHKLADLISKRIGTGWINMPEQLRRLEAFEDDEDFQNQWRQIKFENKESLAHLMQERTGIVVKPDTLFDVQVKRIHEYKRQHLNVLYIITLYNRLLKNPELKMVPRTFIFGGKAAPGYFFAKLIIKLINSVAEIINSDVRVKDSIKVVFFPNYNVKNAQEIFPAAELSEQISLAGMEASGTGNMKLALNGALTIGTLDGANIQIREEVGEDNFFLFGLTAQEAISIKKNTYSPSEYFRSNQALREAVEMIRTGYFSKGDLQLFKPLTDSLLNYDPYMLFADYQSYVDAQDRVSEAYLDQKRWTKMSIHNAANMGKFSSDRAIREYNAKIWHSQPIKLESNNLLEQFTFKNTC
ncbi:Glycogen phosphorylase [Chlamydiales bacterium STE3]|nr:Glycogen phosphorylase [Chlamydiales bacterium STE3]